jgi:nitrogen fixation protein NifQ
MSELEIMERDIASLLHHYGVNAYAQTILGKWIAYESLKMNHLYHDLGFKSRTEMGKFMQRNYPLLAKQKPKDKLWKKFLYDKIGKVAPACASCNDQLSCFSCLLVEMSA